MTTALRRRARAVVRGGSDRGAAIVEFVLLAVVVFVPITFGVIAFSAVQRSVFASTEAARQAGRAIGTAPDFETGLQRADYAARLAAVDQGIDGGDVDLWVAPRGASCDSVTAGYVPDLGSGEVFVVCVRVTVRVPLVPQFMDRNTSTGQFVVYTDQFR